MAFHSLTYLTFLAAVFVAHHATPERWRWFVLLVASLAFYAWLREPFVLVALGVVTLAAWYGAIAIERAPPGRRGARLWVAIGVITLALVLPFLIASIPEFLGAIAFPAPRSSRRALVTIGLSYFAFQGIAYVADVYLERIRAEPNLGHVALFLAFFPKLLQGPIERGAELLPQLQKPYRFDYTRVRGGLLLIGWGLLQKLVLADTLGPYVDQVFGDVRGYPGVTLATATYVYALQIYFDFLGYTNIAIGSAQLFGIHLTQNFDAPYLSTSVAEFWRRWHISFSRWILEYVFKPLQIRWRDWRSTGTTLALLTTFAISGLWHGATWGFLAWGCLHGIYLSTGLITLRARQGLRQRLPDAVRPLLKPVQILITFHLICFAWIFFRANSISDALYVAGHLLSEGSREAPGLGGRRVAAIAASTLLVVAPALPWRKTWDDWASRVLNLPTPIRWAAYFTLFYVALYRMTSGDAVPQYIYFRF